MNTFFQVVGRGTWTIDYPHGDSKAHRTGDVFEARQDNASVLRGLRTGRLRQLENREANALRAAQAPQAVTPKSGLPPITPAPKANS